MVARRYPGAFQGPFDRCFEDWSFGHLLAVWHLDLEERYTQLQDYEMQRGWSVVPTDDIRSNPMRFSAWLQDRYEHLRRASVSASASRRTVH